MRQAVAAVSPNPIASPIADATGPLTASMNATAAAITSDANVITSCNGRSFQIGRPSLIS